MPSPLQAQCSPRSLALFIFISILFLSPAEFVDLVRNARRPQTEDTIITIIGPPHLSLSRPLCVCSSNCAQASAEVAPPCRQSPLCLSISIALPLAAESRPASSTRQQLPALSSPACPPRQGPRGANAQPMADGFNQSGRTNNDGTSLFSADHWPGGGPFG